MAVLSVPLIELGPNQEGTVVALEGGRGLVSRLATLGFTPGAPLTMVQNFGHGPVIVRVRDARIALGRGQALKILVRRSKGDGRSDG
jgi:ferrous iron transport protein A